MGLSGKHVVIIGGTSGIGFAVAEGAARDGARLTIASSRQATIDAALKRLPAAEGHRVDVKDEAGLGAFFAKLGSLDHLVFTAGDWGGPGGRYARKDGPRACGQDFCGALLGALWRPSSRRKNTFSRAAPSC